MMYQALQSTERALGKSSVRILFVPISLLNTDAQSPSPVFHLCHQHHFCLTVEILCHHLSFFTSLPERFLWPLEFFFARHVTGQRFFSPKEQFPQSVTDKSQYIKKPRFLVIKNKQRLTSVGRMWTNYNPSPLLEKCKMVQLLRKTIWQFLK